MVTERLDLDYWVVERKNSPNGRPSVAVEPGLILGVQISQKLGVFLTNVIVVGGKLNEAPLNEFVRVVHLNVMTCWYRG